MNGTSEISVRLPIGENPGGAILVWIEVSKLHISQMLKPHTMVEVIWNFIARFL